MADVTFLGKQTRHVIGDLVFKKFTFTVNGSMTLPTGMKQILAANPTGVTANIAFTITAIDSVTGIITVNSGGLATDQELIVISRVG